MPMRLSSPAFEDDGRIPDLYTCVGRDLSPPLAWTEVPADAHGFAITCEDPDAPRGTWHHWAIFDIPAHARELPEDYPKVAGKGSIRQAVNDFGRPGYGGPCPPEGDAPHRYRFRLFAVDLPVLPVGDDPDCRQVGQALLRHLVAEAELVGMFSR